MSLTRETSPPFLVDVPTYEIGPAADHDCETGICWCRQPFCWLDDATPGERVWLGTWVVRIEIGPDGVERIVEFDDLTEEEQRVELDKLRAEPWHQREQAAKPHHPELWPWPGQALTMPSGATGTASEALAGMSVGIQPAQAPGSQPAGLPPTVRDRYPATDWGSLLDAELPPLEQWPGSLLARGEQASLVGPGKVGKSLVALDMSYRIAAGLPWLGDPARDPARVLYLDKENGQRVFIGRMKALGFRPCPNLVYLSFPNLPALDTPAGGRELMDIVSEYRPDLVVFDTVSRFISGKENESDTWLALYNNSLMPLKGAGIASLRLDHTGKDVERGSRGSSAKSQDVDHVWGMSEVAGLYLLERTDTRTGDGISRRWIERKADRGPDGGWTNTRHLSSDGPDAPKGGQHNWLIQEQIIKWVVDNIGTDAGNPRVKARKAELEAHLRGEGGSPDFTVSDGKIREALAVMKERIGRGESPTLPEVPPLPS